MHTLVYPTYLLRPPLAPGARIPESREIPELKRKNRKQIERLIEQLIGKEGTILGLTVNDGTHVL